MRIGFLNEVNIGRQNKVVRELKTRSYSTPHFQLVTMKTGLFLE